MIRYLIGDQRGSVLLFTTVLLAMLLVMGGMAFDLAYQMSADNELQRSMDAAALAGAGNLGFDSTAFPTARQAAQSYAGQNPFHELQTGGNINLNLNTANATNGNIVLGIWDPSKPAGVGTGNRFEPSLDGTRVNSVLCQFQSTVPTSFLRLLGFNNLPVTAFAIAVANPPATPPPNACLFPIGLGDCPFAGNSSLGCGVAISFITSSTKTGPGGENCLNPPCTNTAAWVRIDGGSDTPNASYLRDAITGAASGNCPPSPISTGQDIPTSNGMVQSVFDHLEPYFIEKYNASAASPITIKNSSGEVVYTGQGWEVYLPVIDTACPPGPISGDKTIVGFTKFVMTQVINKGDCAVANHNPPNNEWDPIGKTPNCTGTNVPQNSGAVRGIFGYYACELNPANPNPFPAPRSALAQRLRLVE